MHTDSTAVCDEGSVFQVWANDLTGDQTHTQTLTLGETIRIEGMANAGTGYRWELIENGAPVLAASGPSIAPVSGNTPDVVGGPTATRWCFVAKKPGSADVLLTYGRPWEKDDPSATKRVRLRFNVR